ncbi:MAG: TonB-dependent receptor plug domain-containing protein [Bacteroidales bacterium]|jgi:iron complex outermembrane receptor protein|nr:TonB-dependent receptor plug domain-containing protein [Bacteroidales bacterium]
MRVFLLGSLLFLSWGLLLAQPKPVEQLTKEDILSMDFDELSAYSMGDVVKIAGMVGVPIEDLFNMLLNKDVSIASKHDESYFDTPLSTSVLTSADIERSGALSIPEALRLLPGVIVREKTNGNYDVQLRGSNNIIGQQNLFSENTMALVMIDGRTVYSYMTGGTFWESFPIGMGDVERIEVIRGAASAMYGANAVTGVINIITKKTASEKVSVEANVATGGLLGGASPASGGGVGTQHLAAFFNVNDKLSFRVAGNNTYRDRTQSDIYFYLTEPIRISGLSNKYYPVDSVVIHGADPQKLFKNPDRSLQSYGVTGLASYTPADKVRFDLTTGIQRSTAITSNMDFYYFAHSERQSSLHFVNLQSEIYGFNIRADYTWGWNDLASSIPGFKTDKTNLNVNVEYGRRFGKMAISPGIDFVYNTINSTAYEQDNQSYFDGKQILYSFAPSIHADYQPSDNLRLIGGLRMENNKIPEKPYFTWQLAGNYKLGSTNIFRAVYSRANKSPFMMDFNSSSSVQIRANKIESLNTLVQMTGDKDLKLVVADMFELGYRRKIGKQILLNLELFHSQTKNFSAAEVEMLEANIDLSGTPENMLAGLYTNPPIPSRLEYRFKNIPEKQLQTGATFEVGVVVSDKMNFRLWGTFQMTDLVHHNDSASTLMTMGNRLGNDVFGYIVYNKPMGYHVAGNLHRITDKSIPPVYVNKKSEMAPAYFGGYELNWQFAEKFSLFSNGYGFTGHRFSNQFLSTSIKARMIVNAKITYSFVENASLYFCVNNILNQTDPEFGFMDKIGVQWYLGFRFKL